MKNDTVTSRLFMHIVSTEKLRKDMRGIKHTYYNGSFFFILLLVKCRLRTFRLLTICLLYLKIRKQKIKLNKYYRKKDLNFNKMIKFFYLFC